MSDARSCPEQDENTFDLLLSTIREESESDVSESELLFEEAMTNADTAMETIEPPTPVRKTIKQAQSPYSYLE